MIPTRRSKSPPRSVQVYGVMGLSGFLGPPVVAFLVPDHRELAMRLLVAYAALILSFLGGARWGVAVARPAPSPLTVSLAMLPTLFALGLMTLPVTLQSWQIGGLILGLTLHWLWDIRSKGLPDWYPGLRTLLSGGAVAGLIAGGLFLLA